MSLLDMRPVLLALLICATGVNAGLAAPVLDPAVVGTWTMSAALQGARYTMFMRLDETGYRSWAEGPKGTIAGDSGSLVTTGGRMYIKKAEGSTIDATYVLDGRDTLVLVKANGSRQPWRRASNARPPGEATAGAGLSNADRKDPHKCYDEGTRLYRAKEMKAAAVWFQRAAELGLPKAQLQIGWHYERGIGVLQSFFQAVAWYQRAADQGNAVAMKNLGQLYEDGTGVPQDWVQAARWYQKGADLADADSEAALGRAYQFGIGVPQHRGHSIHWSKRAWQHGDTSSEHWVRWLSDPTNNIGFRNEEEHQLVMGGQLRTTGLLFGADPAGLLFRNSGERITWLRGFRKAVDKAEEESRRELAIASQRRHEGEVRRLESAGMGRDEAERKAGW